MLSERHRSIGLQRHTQTRHRCGCGKSYSSQQQECRASESRQASLLDRSYAPILPRPSTVDNNTTSSRLLGVESGGDKHDANIGLPAVGHQHPLQRCVPRANRDRNDIGRLRGRT